MGRIFKATYHFDDEGWIFAPDVCDKFFTVNLRTPCNAASSDDNKVGVVYDIAGIFTECGLSIDSLVTCRQPYGKYEIVVRGNIPNVDEISEKIKAKGYEIIHTARIG